MIAYRTILRRDPCSWCGCLPSDACRGTVDHIEPASHGGSDRIENLTAACGWCNYRRGSRSVLRWLEAQLKWARHQGHPLTWRLSERKAAP